MANSQTFFQRHARRGTRPIDLDWASTALVIIDMQRDFMEPGGFGETLGNDVSLSRAVRRSPSCWPPRAGRGCLSSIPAKATFPISPTPPRRSSTRRPALRIGDPGPMGRILIRGENGHDIIPEPIARGVRHRQARQGRVLCDRPRDPAHGIENLLVCGVTTEVCVNTTVREATIAATAARARRLLRVVFPGFHEAGLKMIKAQGGIFGWVSNSAAVVKAMTLETSNKLVAGASR